VHRSLLAQGRVATLQRWLAQIPEPFIQARPVLRIRQAWATFLKGEVNQAETMLLAARRSLLASPPSREQETLRGELATYLATIAFFREEADDVIRAAKEALAYLPPEAVTARARATNALGLGVSLAGNTRRAMQLFQESVTLARSADNPFFLAHALEVLADGYFHSAHLRRAAETCREIIALGTENRAAPLAFAGNGYVKIAGIYLEWRELDKAEEAMVMGLALNQQGGIGYNALQDMCTLVRLKQATGDEDEALAALRQAEAAARRNLSRITGVQLASCAVQFWLQAGDVDRAASWAEAEPLFGTPLASMPTIVEEVQQVSMARVYLAKGQPDMVLHIYDQLHPQAKNAGRMGRVIEIGLLAALAHQMKGQITVALEILRPILTLTEPEGYTQIFVELGEPVRELLQRLPANEQSRLSQTLQQALFDVAGAASTAMVEPLSPREMDVLCLIAAGLSNKQIAAELTVTLNTIKKHTSHIYSKLAVNGRTQAIARARELHLI
jgi:LuxR family maltose regulon positive regulatory protein